MAGFMLDRRGLIDAFGALGRLAWDLGKTIEVAVYGGSALMLSYDWRLATKDVDGVYENDRETVRLLATQVAEERGWPADWLNDGVKGFLSIRDGDAGVKTLYGEFPSSNTPGLRVFVPRPEYLFAMKCRAMRIGGADENGDVNDIRRLAEEIGIADAADALVLPARPASAEHPVRHRGDLFGPGWQDRPKNAAVTDLALRPQTLLEVSRRTAAGTQPFDPALREFLDEFYSHPTKRRAAMAEEPLLLDDVKDAYLAAVAEHLAMRYDMRPPDWAEGHGRPLKRAFFAGGLESLKAMLTVESPAAFRRRLLFVSKNALDRPSRRDTPETDEGPAALSRCADHEDGQSAPAANFSPAHSTAIV